MVVGGRSGALFMLRTPGPGRAWRRSRVPGPPGHGRHPVKDEIGAPALAALGRGMATL